MTSTPLVANIMLRLYTYKMLLAFRPVVNFFIKLKVKNTLSYSYTASDAPYLYLYKVAEAKNLYLM